MNTPTPTRQPAPPADMPSPYGCQCDDCRPDRTFEALQ
jgi:hypothetical protein